MSGLWWSQLVDKTKSDWDATSGPAEILNKPNLDALQVPASPVDGGTVSCPATSRDVVVYLTPAIGLGSLTVNLPSDASTKLQQAVIIFSEKSVDSLNVGGATTVHNSDVLLSAGDCVIFTKVGPNTWSRAL